MSLTANSPLPAVSIAMATYNGGKFLAEQLESLSSQTHLPVELVITDDGSTDDTAEIIRVFAEKVSFPVRFSVNPERLGYADNFLRAASLCTAPLISFCDQDDRWLPEKLAMCAHAMRDPAVLLCVHSAESWDGTRELGNPYPEIKTGGIFPQSTLDPFYLVPGFAMVVRAELLRLVPNSPRPRHLLDLASPHEKAQAHDSWCWLLASTTGRIALLSERLALYRQHAMNAIGAPEKDTTSRSMSLAMSDFNYGPMADLEAEYAVLIDSFAAKLPAPRREFALQAADSMRFRSECHRLRAKLYDRTNGIVTRLHYFFDLLSAGAYWNSSSKSSLGFRAMLKDLLVGVPGLHVRRSF